MDVSRRSFLKMAASGALASPFGFDVAAAATFARTLKIAHTTETRSICPYCSVSCGVIVHTRGNGKNTRRDIVHVEGDPDHPINRGTLCPKGATLEHYVRNDRRLTRVLHRAPGASAWTPMAWDDAIERIARLVKTTRDASFVERDAEGRTVNRWEDVAAIGGCTDTNELNWLFQKTARALGIVHLEQQSRI
jgi:formate dehydrogenase major subunit